MKRFGFLCRCAALPLSPLLLTGCGGGSDTDSSDPVIIATSPPPSATPLHFSVSEIARVRLGGRLVARNSSGSILGSWFVLKPDGTIQSIPTLEGYDGSTAAGINRSGMVVGSSKRAGSSTEDVGFMYNPQTGKTTLLSAMRRPTVISDAGMIAGYDFHLDPSSSNYTGKSLVYDIATGTTTELPDFGGDTYFSVSGINNDGWVGGRIVGAKDGAMALYNLKTKMLKTVRSSGVYSFTAGGFISEGGKVGGVDSAVKDGFIDQTRAFIYDINSGVKTYLPQVPVLLLYDLNVFYINASGDAALQVAEGSERSSIFLYRDGRLQELSTTLSSADQAPWRFENVIGIDDSGAVYVAAYLKQESARPDSYTSVLRLTPQ